MTKIYMFTLILRHLERYFLLKTSSINMVCSIKRIRMKISYISNKPGTILYFSSMKANIWKQNCKTPCDIELKRGFHFSCSYILFFFLQVFVAVFVAFSVSVAVTVFYFEFCTWSLVVKRCKIFLYFTKITNLINITSIWTE